MANGVLTPGRPALHVGWASPSSHETRDRIRALAQRHPTLAQLARYAVVGGASTGLNALIYLLARDWLAAVPANLVALLASTALSTEVNRRFTFDGAATRRWRASLQDIGTVVFYAFYSSLVLVVLVAVVPGATEWEEALAVAAASVLGGLLRFAVLRYWVFEVPAADPADG